MRRPVMLLCVMALAGCGGDDGDGGGGGERLSKAEFSAEGKRICEAGAKRTQEVVAKAATSGEVRDMSEQERSFHLIDTARPVVEDTLDEIDGLAAPEEVEADVKTLTDGVRETQELLAGIESEKDAEEVTPRLQELVDETRTAARAAGLEACLPENTP